MFGTRTSSFGRSVRRYYLVYVSIDGVRHTKTFDDLGEAKAMYASLIKLKGVVRMKIGVRHKRSVPAIAEKGGVLDFKKQYRELAAVVGVF